MYEGPALEKKRKGGFSEGFPREYYHGAYRYHAAVLVLV